TYPVEEALDHRAPRIRFAASRQGVGKGGNSRRGVYKSIGINRWLRALGFVGKTTSGAKFIPEKAKQTSVESRIRLMAAMWDGDGFVGPKLAYYKTISRQLAEDVAEVLLSLGIP